MRMSNTSSNTKLSVADLVQLIETGIISGDFPLGEALPGERSFATTYSVGRPLVREAIQSLAARGLVEISPGRGTFVKQVTSFGQFDAVGLAMHSTPRQVVEARVTIESQTTRLAAARATDVQLGLMEAALDRMEHASDQVERVSLDMAFHLTIARASNNPVLAAMLASIAPLMAQLIMRSIADGHTAGRANPLHRKCLEAIRAGDADLAEEVMVSHLRVADSTFGSDYDEQLDTTTSLHARQLVASYGSLDALVAAVLGSPPA